jgi:hypothetical protein
MNNKEYNGSYNYETWCTHMRMSNTKSSYDMWRQVARDSIEAEESGHEGTNWFYFEDVLTGYLESLQESMINSDENMGLIHDFVSGAISEVNTREIAMQWVSDELEMIEVTE